MLLRRLSPLPFVLLGASVLVFALPRLTGADIARTVLRARVDSDVPDAATQARVAAEFGLDGSAVEQYLRWLAATMRGDLGLSFVTRSSVSVQVLQAVSVSGVLMAAALGLALAVGVPAGVYAANRPGGLVDRVTSAAGIVGVAIPEFVLAPWLVLIAAVGLGVLPAAGWGDPRHAVLPVLTLSAYPMALVAQLLRSETVEVLTYEHIRVARSKGLTRTRVLWRHAARLSLTSVTALSGMFVAGLLGGSVVVEVVFGIPGLGRLLYDSVLARDLPVLQAATMVVIAVAVVGGVVVELAQLALDPVARRPRR
ncbi:MAG: hypothetical protein ABS81_20325 [Pseudonocardia sp. SCN 72-86]|nr:MAG: hypothetical protein ABS81_20325 [Pseudonocardia sp. SCN 72-86]